MFKFKSWQLIAMAICVFFASCKKEQNLTTHDNIVGGKGNFLIEAIVKNPDGASGQSYLLQIPYMQNTLDLSNSIPVDYSSPISTIGNDIYVFPGEMAGAGQTLYKYQHSNEGLKKIGQMQLIANSWAMNITQVSNDKAYIPMYNLSNIWVINPKTMQKIGEIDLSSYAHSDQNCDPSIGIVRDGYYYLPLNQIGQNYMPYPDYRQVDVVVIDTKTDKPVKMISESTSNLCFPTRPLYHGMIFTDEQNNIYIACAGFFGYNPQYKNNGFVCIPSGKQEFDPSKSWDISNVVIKGSDYKSVSIYNCLYVGNGKVAAYLCISELNGDNPYTAKNSMAVIMDLNAKSITKIDGIPYSDPFSLDIEKEGDNVLFCAYGDSSAGIFSYNMKTNKTSQILSSKNNIGYIHLFN